MKKILCVLIFALLSILPIQAYADSISNEHLIVNFNNSGSFVAKTADGKTLMFNNPTTSYTTFKIDDLVKTFAGTPVINGNVCTTNYFISEKNVNIQQIVSLVYNTYTKKNDTVEIKYIVTNQDSASKSIGTRIMLDTMIETNDGAPFRIPVKGDLIKETELSGASVPQYWQVFNDLNNPRLFAQGTLTSNSYLSKPDKIQFVSWRRINGVPWEYTISSSDIGDDSAVAMYWSQKALASGESREYVTYYGLGAFETNNDNPVAISISGQNEANAGDTFTVTAYFQKKIAGELKNVTAELQLPPQMSVSTPRIPLGNFSSDEMKMCSWDVKISPDAADNEYTYTINVTSDSGNKSLSKKINIKSSSNVIPAEWFRTINSVHSENIDENNLVLKSTTDVSYWIPWQNDFNVGSTGKERYLFQTTIPLPKNIAGLTLTKDGIGNISIDDSLGVFVNGFKIAEPRIPGVDSITIDKKYLIPGANNNILLILKDEKASRSVLSKLKIQASFDTSYDASKTINLNGFEIQYDTTNPSNSKVFKYPDNLLFMNDSGNGFQFKNAVVETDSEGNIHALLEADLSSSIYTYNGWHRNKKLFSSDSNSKIIFELRNDYTDVLIDGVRFDIPMIDIYGFKSSIPVSITVTDTQSLMLLAPTDFEIFNEDTSLDFSIEIAGNKIIPYAYGEVDVTDYLDISSYNSTSGIYTANSLCLDGEFTYDIFNENVSDYSIKAYGYDDSKIRFHIPQFGELAVDSLEITDDKIKTEGVEFTFSEDCIFEGLRPSNGSSNYTYSISKLSFNRKCTSFKDLIAECDLSITLKNDVELFGGIKLESGSQLTGGVYNGVFGIGFNGRFILPDDDLTRITVNFAIDGNGDIEFEGSVTLNKRLNILGLNLTPDSGLPSTIKIKYEKAVYNETGLVSPKKFIFSFENIGTNIDIKDAGNVRFNITQFTINGNGKLEDIKGKISGDISLFNSNLKISTGTSGSIDLEYTLTNKKIIATNVTVEFPNVGDKGFKALTNLTMSSSDGLESFSLTDKDSKIGLLGDVITINGLSLSLNKNKDTNIYSLEISAQNTTCDIKKAIPKLDGEASITVNDMKLKVADLKNPSVDIDCGDITYNRDMKLDLGIKFNAKGLTLNIKNKAIILNEPSLTLPSIGGLKFYSDGDCKNPVESLTVALSYIKVTYGSKWDLSVGNVSLPGSCVYNLAEANVCKIVLKNLSMGSAENGNFEFRIKSASATVASGFTTELSDVTISDTVSIGGGSITIPDLSLGGIGINNFKVTFGVEKIGEKKYPYFGGSCGVTIPGLASIDGSLTVQRYSENFFKTIKGASFELTLGKAIPLGATGLALKMIRGSLTRGELPSNFPDEFRFMFDTGNNIKVVSMGLGFVDTTSGGKTLTAGADVWVEITNWGFALSANATVFEGFIQAEAGAAYANEIFAAYAKVRVLCVQGKIVFYVYKYDGKTSVSGEGSVAVKLDAGKILNKKIFRWRIKIPKNDVWFEGISAKFGRFTNGKQGFQGSVGFPILGKMSAFVGDGGLKFFTNYDIYIPKPATTSKTTALKTPILASLAPVGLVLGDSTGSSATSGNPVFEDIYESGVYKGSSVEFKNNASLDRIVLSASTDNGIPNIVITDPNGNIIPLNDANIEYEVKEVNEVDDVTGDETGKVGIAVLLALKNPQKGDWKIEAMNDEAVTLSLITKLNDPTLKINNVVEDKGAKTLTVTGEIVDSNNKENVNIIMKGISNDLITDDVNTLMPSERIVATSNPSLNIDGIQRFSITDGKFTVVIDTSVMKSGKYSLVAEMERQVMCSIDGEIFNENGTLNDSIDVTPDPSTVEEYDEYSREEYKVGDNVVIYEFSNSVMKKVTNFNASVSSYGTELFEKGDVFNTFITKLLNRGTDDKLNYIWNKLPKSFSSDISDPDKDKFEIVSNALNTYIIKNPDFYNSTIFKPSDPQITQAINLLLGRRSPGVDSVDNRKLNRLLLEAYFPQDFSSNLKYSINLSFNNSTKTADGYMMIADCYVEGENKGTRSVNLGSLTETTLNGYTLYKKVADNGSISLKPVELRIRIVPYRFIDPLKGFIYNYGIDLWPSDFGIEKEKDNIVLGPVSDEVILKLEKKDSFMNCSFIMTIPPEGFTVPLEEFADINMQISSVYDATLIAEVDSVSARTVTKNGVSVEVENVSVLFENSKIQIPNGTSISFPFKIIANIDADEVSSYKTGFVKLRLTNANNPDDFRIVSVPYNFTILPLKINNVYPEIINSTTGGIIDIYGEKFIKGTKVYLGTTQLDIIENESGIGRIAVRVPENFSQGQYDLKIEGPGTSNTVIWKNKINIVTPYYQWVPIRDTGKIQSGTSGKFYVSFDSKTGYLGKASIRVKSMPAGWGFITNKNTIDMNEILEMTITVPTGEPTGKNEIVLEGSDSSNSGYYVVGKLNVEVTSTPLAPVISYISKNKGYAGDEFTIYGEGIETTSTAEIVSKAGVAVMLDVITSDSNYLKVRIPSSAVSGNVRINNLGVYSNSLPFTVVPNGIITNFNETAIEMVLVPGESRTVNFKNNSNPISVSSGMYIKSNADTTTGNIKFSVPNDTLPGAYDAIVNIKYPNVTVQTPVIIYVINKGKSSEELSRQVILEGRNLSIKVKGTNIGSLSVATLTLNGTPLTVTPQSTPEGWVIDIGMVNDESVITYKFNYTAYGNSYLTPEYEYIVNYANKKSDSDIYDVFLLENTSGDVTLRLVPKAQFNPSQIAVTYKINNGTDTTSAMTKIGSNWELSLGKLDDDTYVSGYFVYGKGTVSITSQKFLLHYDSKYTSNITIPWTIERNVDGDAIIRIPSTGIILDGNPVTPESIMASIKVGPSNTLNINLILTGGVYIANLGSISNGSQVTPTFTLLVDGKKLKNTQTTVTFKDTGCEDYKNGLIAEYFDNQDLSNIMLKTIDDKIDFDWISSVPAGGLIQNSTYSMRWSGKIQPEFSEEYTLYATVNNGNVRVCINGTELADGYGNQNCKVTLTAAQMTDIVIEYSSTVNGGIKLEWESSSQSREIVPMSRLYATEVDIPLDDDDDDVPNGMLKVQYTNEVNDLTINHLKPVFRIFNTSSKNIPLSDIKVKYWYTAEISGYQEANPLFVSRDQENIELKIQKLDSDCGECYLEVGFKGSSELKPGEFIEVRAMINHINWVNYNQANDYSFKHSVPFKYEDHDKITAYTSGDLAWGIEPANTSPYTGLIDVLSYNENKETTSNSIRPSITVINSSSNTIYPKRIKIRYWFTNETGIPMNINSLYTSLGSGKLSSKIVLNGTSKRSFIEFTFADSAPNIKEGQYFTLNAYINSSNWSNFSQANDYSFDMINSICNENKKITAYIDDNLVWGVEP